MKTIKNTSLQGLSLVLTKPGGNETIYLLPKQKVQVPNSWGGKILETLVSRRMLKVTVVADPQPQPIKTPVKRIRKLKGE